MSARRVASEGGAAALPAVFLKLELSQAVGVTLSEERAARRKADLARQQGARQLIVKEGRTFEERVFAGPKLLPGTNLTHEKAQREFLEGDQPFGIDASMLVRVDGMFEIRDKLIQSVPTLSRKKPMAEGGFNIFYEVEQGDAYLGDQAAKQLGHSADLPIGARIGGPAIRASERLRNFDEAWLTLHASAAGIAPIVLCLYTAAPDDRLAIFMERGKFTLSKFLVDVDALTRVQQYTMSAQLDALFLKAAELRLVMTDIKLDNMVVLANSEVRFIDFDPEFTLFADAAPECINLINMVLFFSSFHCTSPVDEDEAKVRRQLTEAMRAQLAELVKRFTSGESGESGDAPDLCEELLKLTEKDAQSKRGLNVFRKGDTSLIAKLVLERAGHYAEWYADDEYACNKGFDKDKPAIEQIERLIQDAIAPQPAAPRAAPQAPPAPPPPNPPAQRVQQLTS